MRCKIKFERADGTVVEDQFKTVRTAQYMGCCAIRAGTTNYVQCEKINGETFSLEGCASGAIVRWG